MKKKTVKKVLKAKIVKPKIVKPEIPQPEIPQPEIPQPEIPQTEIPQPVIQSVDSQSLLEDLQAETDNDENINDERYEDFETNEDSDNIVTENEDFESSEQSSTQKSEKFSDKIIDTLNNDNNNDYENPADKRKAASLDALMYVEGGSIFLSFIGQLISGDWTPEGELRYMPSEARRKLIREPLAKKIELSKRKSKNSPTAALWTAILFTILPILIIALKDRKKRVENDALKMNNEKLNDELKKANAIINNIQPVQNNETVILKPKIVKGRGRHKLNCACDKCQLKKMKTKK